ncbi:hypothetical protein IAQ67_29305 (plasmid) [Paenibacillus peoriae]|uniref:Uncharacterized protein n=1 Tax=Paenibacillus peoriae TaxID=59893 RepID=A0A7H0YHJ9_9BACL|nr:hypothetical protein [Paenibacillus peoriae]QNR70557.1 hypothetical protein IAQ67_29305 [Paenibacillus peoriae]
MSDTRKNVKVAPYVKSELQAALKDIDLKTESLAIAYLIAMYNDQKHKKILLSDHQAYLKAAEVMNNQGSL